MGRKKISGLARAAHAVDVALAARFDELLADARAAEDAFRKAQAAAAPNDELYPSARRLDAALTDVMRAAYAAARAEIGPLGYDDRIYRRKAKAKPGVHAWTNRAERLLTLRETHRLTGIPPAPRSGPYVGMPDQAEPNRLDWIRDTLLAIDSSSLDEPFNLIHAPNLIQASWSTPQRRLRSIIAMGALVTGAATLTFSSGIAITFLIFGAFTAAHLFFDIAIARAEPIKAQANQQSNQTAFPQFVDASQAAVITAAATILGLITAFSGGALPAAAKVAVIGLGGGVLVLFVSRSSQARLSATPAARLLGACADIIGFSLFTLGLIGIITSLFITGGLGNRSAHGSKSSAISSPKFYDHEEALEKLIESIGERGKGMQ